MQYVNSQFPMMPQPNPMPVPVYQSAYVTSVANEFYQIRPDDIVILYSLEDYMAQRGVTPNSVRPDEYLRFYESARDVFYSDIVQRLTRVVPYINYAGDNDDAAKGLTNSLAHHMRNPYFIQLMMRQLYQENNQEANGFIGAFLCKAASMYLSEMRAKDELETETTKTKKEKDGKETKVPTPPKKSNVDENVISSMYNAAMSLLNAKYEFVKANCVGIEQGDALAVAAYLAMNNEVTLKEMIKSDLPLTAELFQKDPIITQYPKRIIAAALHLQKADYAKLSVNQTKFIDSLTKWVYARLDAMAPTACLEELVSIYHMPVNDAVKGCLIQIKDCGPQYPQLIQVVRTLKINNN